MAADETREVGVGHRSGSARLGGAAAGLEVEVVRVGRGVDHLHGTLHGLIRPVAVDQK